MATVSIYPYVPQTAQQIHNCRIMFAAKIDNSTQQQQQQQQQQQERVKLEEDNPATVNYPSGRFGRTSSDHPGHNETVSIVSDEKSHSDGSTDNISTSLQLATMEHDTGHPLPRAAKVRKPRKRMRHQILEAEQQLAAVKERAKALQHENTAMGDRLQLLHHAVICREQQLERLKSISDAGRSAQAQSSAAGSVLALLKAGPEELLEHYKTSTSEISALLMQLEQGLLLVGQKVSVVRSVVEAHIDNLLATHAILRLGNANALLIMGRPMARNLPLEAPDSHWIKVLNNLQLTPEQVSMLAALHDLFLSWSSPFLQQRRVLQEQMYQVQATSPSLLLVESNDHKQLAGDLLAACSRQVVDERMLLTLADDIVMTRILGCMQAAQLLVHSFPYIPDIIQLLALLSRAHKASQAV